MILPFSVNYPWTKPDGQVQQTGFERKICAGIKIHTFREGQRWKPGSKIHFYLRNPRNGGVKFQPPVEAVENWFSEFSAVTHSRKKFPQGVDEKTFQEHFTPLVHGVENYKIRVDAIQKLSIHFMLWIEDFLVVRCEFNQLLKTINYLGSDGKYLSSGNFDDGGKLTLRTIAKNDGLSEVGFLRWFINSAKDKKEKESTGQIIHWTPFRYVADIGAEITDSIFANQY